MSSWAGAVGGGLDPSLYEGRAVREGAWVGRLDAKVWARYGPAVLCFFTVVGGGARDDARGVARSDARSDARGGARGDAPERYRLSAYRPYSRTGSAKGYTAKDGAVDFSDDGAAPGDVFSVVVGRGPRGGVRWVSAERSGPAGAADGGADGGAGTGGAS